MKTKQSNTISLKSYGGIIALTITAIFFGNLKYKQYKIEKTIEKEKLKLIQAAENYNKKNRELEESLNYFNSQNFREKTAREQLNLKKEGEQVFAFSEPKKIQNQNTQTQNNKPNYEKWLEYFFN